MLPLNDEEVVYLVSLSDLMNLTLVEVTEETARKVLQRLPTTVNDLRIDFLPPAVGNGPEMPDVLLPYVERVRVNCRKRPFTPIRVNLPSVPNANTVALRYEWNFRDETPERLARIQVFFGRLLQGEILF